MISFVLAIGFKVLTALQSFNVMLGKFREDSAAACALAMTAAKQKDFIVYKAEGLRRKGLALTFAGHAKGQIYSMLLVGSEVIKTDRILHTRLRRSSFTIFLRT